MRQRVEDYQPRVDSGVQIGAVQIGRSAQQQIAAAQPVTSKNTPFRPGELLGTEVRSPQNEALGSIENLVMSPATDKVAYLVIALDRSFGIDGISVPVPLEDFKITPNADLMVLDTTRGILEAPRG